MQTQINAPLQALLQLQSAEQAIKTLLSSGVAPGTVAAQKVQQTAALTQAAPQPQAAPPGIAALMPGVKQQAMMSAQAAQPATQGDVNQLRQMMAQAQQAQPQQNQGIAAGADVQMAEGGIVGYDGRTGSQVEVDETKLSVDERFRRMLDNFIKGTYYGSKRDLAQQAAPTVEPPAPPVPLPVRSDVRRQEIPEGGIVSPGMVRTAAPTPSPRPPAAPRPTATPTSTPASPFSTEPIYPVEAAMSKPSAADARFYELQNLINTYGEQRKQKPELTAEEKEYKQAAEARNQRGIAAIDAAQKRYEDMITTQRGRGLADFLASAGGARSLFSGLGQAQLKASQAEAQREAAKIAYFDKLDERRNAVENLNLAVLQQDAERARAWSQEVRRIDDERNKLLIGLGETRMKEESQAELKREELAARAKENERNIQAQKELEVYRRQTQLMKPRELEEIHRIEALKLNELTGGKPGTATPQQKLEAIQFAHESVKGAGRADSLVTKANTAALRELAEWDKVVGANIKAMNAKNPQVFEDARRAKIREINATLGSTIPLDGGAAGAVDTNNPLLKK